MSDTKFTPDQLEVDFSEWESGDSLSIHSEGALIAEVYGYEEFPCFDPTEENAISQFNERQSAYAALFADSPKMYAALDTIRSKVKGNQLIDPLIQEIILAICNEAIDKAEGL